jgi:hypothetical protein
VGGLSVTTPQRIDSPKRSILAAAARAVQKLPDGPALVVRGASRYTGVGMPSCRAFSCSARNSE